MALGKLSYTKEMNALVKQGFAIETVAGMPYVTMTELVDILLRRDEASLNETFGSKVPPTTTVLAVLQKLQDVLPRLPQDNNTQFMNTLSIILFTLTVVAVALRFVSRKYVTPKQIRIEDWSCLASLFMLTLLHIAYWVANTYGKYGTHVWNLSLWDYRNAQIYLIATQMVFFPSHCMVKIAFLVFFYRLFPQRSYRIAIYAIGAYVVALTLIGIFGCIFQCNIVDWWNFLSTKKCIDTRLFFLTRSAFYSSSDFMILILPVPGIWKLKISRREKVMLISVFGLGIFVSLASVFRLMTLFEWFGSADFFYLIQNHNVWAVVELDLAVVIMCAPAIKVLVSHKNSPLATIPSVIAKNWSRHGTYMPERDSPAYNRTSLMKNFRKSKGSSKSGFSTTEGSELRTVPEHINTTRTRRSGTMYSANEDIDVGKSQEHILGSDEEKGEMGVRVVRDYEVTRDQM